MHREVTLDKIGYMMDRLGDVELNVDDLETLIIKTFVASFDFEYGFEADLIAALVDARYQLLDYDNQDDEAVPTLDKTAAEKWYVECQKKMYMQAGCDEGYAEESSSWPDTLPLNASWDADLLKQLARKEVAHHLVVMEQIRNEMAKRQEPTK
jgi:hypothetical protein